MTYAPDVSKAFINAYRTTMSGEQVIKEIEKVSAVGPESIKEGDKFVIDERNGNHFKLRSVKDILKSPKSKMHPTVEITVNDNPEDEGATIDYKLDLQQNPVSMALVIIMTCVFVGSFTWAACEIFVYRHVVGIIVSCALMILSGWIWHKKLISSTSSILSEFVSVIPYKSKGKQ